jgi:hypothetical protein
VSDLKEAFVRELAVFLVKDQAAKSIRLEMGDANAVAWAALRGKTPLHGYPTVEEAEAVLRDWLGVPSAAPAKKKGRT